MGFFKNNIWLLDVGKDFESVCGMKEEKTGLFDTLYVCFQKNAAGNIISLPPPFFDIVIFWNRDKMARIKKQV